MLHEKYVVTYNDRNFPVSTSLINFTYLFFRSILPKGVLQDRNLKRTEGVYLWIVFSHQESDVEEGDWTTNSEW